MQQLSIPATFCRVTFALAVGASCLLAAILVAGAVTTVLALARHVYVWLMVDK